MIYQRKPTYMVWHSRGKSSGEHIFHPPHAYNTTVLSRNLASAKTVKIEFNANFYLLGFPHFITFKECRKVL